MRWATSRRSPSRCAATSDGRRALIEDYRAKIKAAEEEIAQHDAVTASLRADAEKRRAELAELAEAKLTLEGERSANDRRYRECNELLSQTQAAAGRLEQKRVTAAMEEKQILDKLWESYELSHSAAQEQRIELESVPKASRRINELKREINGLGNVNVGAIEEFDRVNTRYTYLTGQRDDVEKAKEELLGVIENITSEMTVIFKEQFALIRESFQETFLELFGGGKATLELEDENAVLDCGIEIKVQPPGKALKTLSLLSGGEKAFVAIALYFAILKVHPTPFCVMDEIEAALDEPNVDPRGALYAPHLRQDAVHRHHPPPRHDGGRRRALRRDDAGARREQGADHQHERHGERTEHQGVRRWVFLQGSKRRGTTASSGRPSTRISTTSWRRA